MGAEGSPRWGGSFERPQGLFELMDISPGCPIPSQFFVMSWMLVRAVPFGTVLLSTHDIY